VAHLQVSARNTYYQAVNEGSLVWRTMYLFAWPIAVPRLLKRDRLKRSRRQFLSSWIGGVFGPAPDLHVRHDAAVLTGGLLVLPAFILVAITVPLTVVLCFCGVAGPIAAKFSIVGVTIGLIPFLTAVIWSIRATVSEAHYRRWIQSGCPENEVPPANSQPSNIDVVLGLPWAAAMIACCVYFVMN
jgi:hypothetical protein